MGILAIDAIDVDLGSGQRVSNNRRRRQEWKLTGQQATSSGI